MSPAAPAVPPEVLNTLSPITFIIVLIGSGGNLVWSRGVVAVLGEFRRARGGPYWALAGSGGTPAAPAVPRIIPAVPYWAPAGSGGTPAAPAAPAVPPVILAAFQP